MIFQTLKKIFKIKAVKVIFFLLVIAGGYFGYKALSQGKSTVQYATAAVEKGVLVVSISGSGQVSVSKEADIKPKVFGDIVYMAMKNGQEMKAGALLVKIDTASAEKAVRDAEISLETAKLEMEELLNSPDGLSLLQAENSLAKAKDTKKKAEANIGKVYEDTFNSISDVFLYLPEVMSDLKDTLYSDEIARSRFGGSGPYMSNEAVFLSYFSNEKIDKARILLEKAKADYKLAEAEYNKSLQDYNLTDRSSQEEVIVLLLSEAMQTLKTVSQSIKSETAFLDFVADYALQYNMPLYSKISDYETFLKSYSSKINNYLSSLFSKDKSLQDSKEAIADADQAIEEKELALENLKAGPDELEVRAKNIVIQHKEDALDQAKQNLADYYIYAPFDGVVAKVEAQKGDSVSTGSIIANVITKQQIAEISLNEVDAAKVKTGQKAELIFDALPDLTVSGKAIEIDTVGTVSQGVVSYNVKISFDTEEQDIKSGMSVTADIIVDSRKDVLLLPSSAVKSQGDLAYVELVEAPEDTKQQLLANASGQTLSQPPKIQVVETGISNDTYVEITNGLNEGDVVVTSVITEGSNQNSQNSQNRSFQEFRIPGMGGQQIIREIR